MYGIVCAGTIFGPCGIRLASISHMNYSLRRAAGGCPAFLDMIIHSNFVQYPTYYPYLSFQPIPPYSSQTSYYSFMIISMHQTDVEVQFAVSILVRPCAPSSASTCHHRGPEPRAARSRAAAPASAQDATAQVANAKTRCFRWLFS